MFSWPGITKRRSMVVSTPPRLVAWWMISTASHARPQRYTRARDVIGCWQIGHLSSAVAHTRHSPRGVTLGLGGSRPPPRGGARSWGVQTPPRGDARSWGVQTPPVRCSGFRCVPPPEPSPTAPDGSDERMTLVVLPHMHSHSKRTCTCTCR